MREPISGQRGLEDEPGAPAEYVTRWEDVPPAVLLAFVRNLSDRLTFRGVAKLVGLAPETVRKYVEGIGVPFRATRKRFAELFLEHHAGGYMEKSYPDGSFLLRETPLRTLLPAGEENARAELQKLFALARSAPDGRLPEWLDGMQWWLEQKLAREYEAEARVARLGERPRQRRRAPKSDG